MPDIFILIIIVMFKYYYYANKCLIKSSKIYRLYVQIIICVFTVGKFEYNQSRAQDAIERLPI